MLENWKDEHFIFSQCHPITANNIVNCLPNSADSVMDCMKNKPNVLKLLKKTRVDFVSRHHVPYLADIAMVSKCWFILRGNMTPFSGGVSDWHFHHKLQLGVACPIFCSN